jgi:hypothetical protein
LPPLIAGGFLSGHGFPHPHAARFLTEYFHLLPRCTNFPRFIHPSKGVSARKKGEQDKFDLPAISRKQYQRDLQKVVASFAMTRPNCFPFSCFSAAVLVKVTIFQMASESTLKLRLTVVFIGSSGCYDTKSCFEEARRTPTFERNVPQPSRE